MSGSPLQVICVIIELVAVQMDDVSAFYIRRRAVEMIINHDVQRQSFILIVYHFVTFRRWLDHNIKPRVVAASQISAVASHAAVGPDGRHQFAWCKWFRGRIVTNKNIPT